jgi:hypothetical protein
VQDSVEGSCKHSNDPLSLKKEAEFFDQLGDYKLFKRNLIHGVNYPMGI